MSLRTPRSDAGSDPAAGAPANERANGNERANANGENGVRVRLDALSQPIREKLEDPISKVSTLTKRTMALFPVRVWRHFLARNGFLLSSGMSYQALFAIFAAVYVVFAIAGIWLTGDPETLDAFVKLLNTYAPGLIGDNGLISTDELTEIATSSTSLFGLTGAVALVGLIWTAIGWVTYSRLAVRSIFGLPKDMRAYVLLKARDFLAALGFGTALVAAAVLSAVMTSFFGWLTDVTGVDPSSTVSTTALAVGGFVVVFGIDTTALAVLFRFLSGASMPWRRMWVGSLLGSAALTLLQLLSGWLVSRVSTNPLLATFTVFVALLLWFRLVSIVILVAASWVAVEASDHNETLRRVTAEELLAEQREHERMALLTAARVKVREARAALDTAEWWERIPARRRLAKAEQELARVEADAPSSAAAGAAGKVGGLP